MYIDFLRNELNKIKLEKNYDVILEISNEQAFASVRSFAPNTIYVVLKTLASSIEYNVRTQPIQIMVLTEQNKQDVAKELMETYVNKWNWYNETTNGTYTKHEYSTPVVLSNFNEVGFGYRSVVYVSGTLQIMENVIDLKSITIDGNVIEPFSVSVSYQMNGNTQALYSSRIAVTEKIISTLQITLMLPLLNNDFINKILSILSEETNGNQIFDVSLQVGSYTINTDLKLINAQLSTAPNATPSIQVALMR